MTYRHHSAELEEIINGYAIYSYTPDCITNKHWGKIKFTIEGDKYEVIEYAKDGGSIKWQENVCIALLSVYKNIKKENKNIVPSKLRFVA